MDSKTEKDPFDLNFKKKVRMKDFLVFKESSDDQDNYKIIEFENTKEQNFEVLQFIQKMIKSNPDMNSSQFKAPTVLYEALLERCQQRFY